MLHSKEIYFVCVCVVLRLRGLYNGQWLFFSRNRLRGKCEVLRQRIDDGEM